MDEPKPLTSAFTKTANFSIHEVDEVFRDAAQPAAGAAARAARPPVTLPPILGPLSAFTGTFTGQRLQHDLPARQQDHADADAGTGQHDRAATTCWS